MGRKSTFTPEIAAEICERLSTGETLQSICRDEHMPAVRTVSDWKDTDQAFAADFARARDSGFDAIAEDTLQIADDDSRDWEFVRDADGNPIGIKVDGEHVQRSKLRIETRLKLLAKWDPKRYGDRTIIAGDERNPLVFGRIVREVIEIEAVEVRAIAHDKPKQTVQ